AQPRRRHERVADWRRLSGRAHALSSTMSTSAPNHVTGTGSLVATRKTRSRLTPSRRQMERVLYPPTAPMVVKYSLLQLWPPSSLHESETSGAEPCPVSMPAPLSACSWKLLNLIRCSFCVT